MGATPPVCDHTPTCATPPVWTALTGHERDRRPENGTVPVKTGRLATMTYCEDELPSRIDFGKNKYGGPFSTEQVEDVKTVLRHIPLVIMGGAIAGGVVISNFFRNELSD